jgi:hypothetical protein
MTPEQEHAFQVQARAERIQKAYDRADAARRRKERLADFGASLAGQFRRMPSRIDAALRLVAGEGNEILYRFLQVALVVLCVLILFGVAYAAFSVVRFVFGF